MPHRNDLYYRIAGMSTPNLEALARVWELASASRETPKRYDRYAAMAYAARLELDKRHAENMTNVTTPPDPASIQST